MTEKNMNREIKKILSERDFHACLIEGKTGQIRDEIVNFAAMRLLCREENAPCGQCRNCKKFQAGNHPDLIRIDAALPVEEMRRALSGLLLLPNEAKTRVYIIENAGDMSRQTQNVLLKPIEEPPPFAAFLLVTERKEALLETVRSRCFVLSVEDPGEEDPPENAVRFLDCVRQGLYTQAEEFLDFPGREEQRIFLRACLREVKKRLLCAAKEKQDEDLDFYSRLEQAIDKTASACEYNVNIKLWNTVFIARCFAGNPEQNKERRGDFPG